MEKIKVGLRPIISMINLPTVIKTAIFPGDTSESIFIATQVGEIYYIRKGMVNSFIDLRSQIIKLGAMGGYDERGLLGLAFYPKFNHNGLFYLHYTVAGTQGTGANVINGRSFTPNPCDPATLNLKWVDRENNYDHIDTVEEWILSNGQPQKKRTLLNLRRPFANHNGVNSLNFSMETNKLVLTTGDGGLGYDPFNLSQNDLEVAGKIIEIDISRTINNPPIVSRFDELPLSIQEALTVIAKGVRNISGISYQKYYDKYIKYIGNVGQDLVEAIFSFVYYQPIPVTRLVNEGKEYSHDELINFGWRGWEGAIPSTVINKCSPNSVDEKTIAYYDEFVKTSTIHLQPLISYFHQESRPDKFKGTALTGVKPYMGKQIPDLTNSIVFIV